MVIGGAGAILANIVEHASSGAHKTMKAQIAGGQTTYKPHYFGELCQRHRRAGRQNAEDKFRADVTALVRGMCLSTEQIPLLQRFLAVHGNEVARDQMNFLPPTTIALNEKMLRNSLFTLHKQLLKGRYVGAYFDEAPAEHCKSM